MYDSLGAQELARMTCLHDESSADRAGRSPKMWDTRIEVWKRASWEDNVRNGAAMNRIKDTAAYLRGQGLLGPGTSVVDIGCGPGRFAAEFARTAQRVVGIDISPRTIEYARQFAKEMGRENTEFLTADFQTMDIAAHDMYEAFDLAYCSITPALGNSGGLQKFMDLSKGWCYMSSFVRGQMCIRDSPQAISSTRSPGWISSRDSVKGRTRSRWK